VSILQSQAHQSAINGATTGREELEERYAHLLEERFALRQHVTYVPNKRIPIQRWFRYKEAFSSDLVRLFLSEFGASPRTHRLFDPFVGCGSTVLAAKQVGFGAWGIDILPVAVFVARVKLRGAEEYNLGALREAIDDILQMPYSEPTITAPGDVRIIRKAYTEDTLNQILFFQEQIDVIQDEHIRDFLQLALLAVLESVSHTSKDGQYLRLRPTAQVSDVREAFSNQLDVMWGDLTGIGQQALPGWESPKATTNAHCYVAQADARDFADKFDDYADIIITSPPYLNRYDYSRIYSLELCLGFVETFEQLKAVRHSLLRSHIESRPAPTDEVHHPALVEVLQNLQGQKLNNPRIPIMIKGYFEDMNLVLRQLARVCRPNAKVALVVANARFHGELIPVDLILSELAGDAGFQTEKIYVTRYKGNSSQQMGRFGRVAVRESVALWQFVGHPTRPEPRQKLQHQPLHSSREATVKQLALFESRGTYKTEGKPALPDFASTKQEIFRAVRKNSIQRGIFAIQTLIAIGFDSLIDEVQRLAEAEDYDPEEWFVNAKAWGIDISALERLNEVPIRYPLYFCRPEYFTMNPRLIAYYRNLAMISQKAMKDARLNAVRYEQGAVPSQEFAGDVTRYLNSIISGIVKAGLVEKGHHIEMAYANLGDTVGGGWRNEVGRLAYFTVVTPLLRHLLSLGILESVTYELKGTAVQDEDGIPPQDEASLSVAQLRPEELEEKITEFEKGRVVYKELDLVNGNRLLLNRQITWLSEDGEELKIGPDLISTDDTEFAQDMPLLWAGELKGGADPAGSDEHWKTATQAFNRILLACEKTGREQPPMSFMATILVDRVACEAQEWLDQGKLTSVYNLTQIAEDRTKEQQFLNDLTSFLGYEIEGNAGDR
jgi:DNA modification methylase